MDHYETRLMLGLRAIIRRSIGLEPTMGEGVGQGSLTGRWKPRPEGCPNIRGGIMLERALPAKTKLWLTCWTKRIAGGQFVSLLVEIADEGGRPSR
jgi:hypothetical protein